MSRLRMFGSRLLGLVRRRGGDDNLDVELRSHLDALTNEHIRRGMNAEEARFAARREFGGVEQTKEAYREQRGLPFLDTLWQDLRFAVRIFAKKPGFTAVAIATLALGIGANTAIFSVVHSVLLQGLPYPEADRLTVVWSIFSNEGRGPASGPELVYLRERSQLFEEFGGIWAQSGALTGEGEPEHVRLGLVTSNFLSMLAIKPQLGRFFLPEEQGTYSAKSVILSDALWRHRFGGNPRLIGKSVHLNGNSITVVGVMPPDFKIIFPEGSSVPPDIDAFVPFASNLAEDPRDQCYIRVIGRLRKGVAIPQAQAELDSIATQLRSEFTVFSEQALGLQVVPLHGDVVRNVRPALLTLFGGVSLVLLIACANVANLLLSRANERQREITLRTAVGAARGRVIRQLLTESILLSCLGGAAALLLGSWAMNLLLSLRPAGMEGLVATAFNLPVFGFTLALSVLAGILFGLAPALGTTKLNLVDSLKEGGRTVTAGRQRIRNVLVAAEVALGFVLLVGAGLLLQTFASLLRVNPGFNAQHVMTVRLSASGVKYQTPESAIHFFRELQKNLSATNGIDSVGVISHLPFDDTLPNWYSYYWPEGAPKPEQNTVMADHRSILPGYFASLGAQFVAGRDFDPIDAQENRPIAVVDDSVAARAWPRGSAIGKKLNVENGNFVRDTVEVVGVVRHLQSHSLTDPVRGQIYLLYPRAVRAHMALTVRSNIDPHTLVGLIRREVANLDKDMPVYGILPMNDYVEKARRPARFTSTLAGIMAVIAVLLACTGIYGVASYSVLQRTGEIGVRMALGARRGEIFAMIMRQGMLPVTTGVLVGLGLSLVLTPLLSRLLFGVRGGDSVTIAATGVLLLGVGVLACYLPARRATRLDPVAALRYE
ncbi:MAG TPA: ABC transporter permease [Candidatus Acidoferrum sp.]